MMAAITSRAKMPSWHHCSTAPTGASNQVVNPTTSISFLSHGLSASGYISCPIFSPVPPEERESTPFVHVHPPKFVTAHRPSHPSPPQSSSRSSDAGRYQSKSPHDRCKF